MKRSKALDLLTKSKPILASRYGIVKLALFGSTAKDSANANSDIDILVTFDGATTSERYFGVLFYLEDLFGCTIDLITEKALRIELRELIKKKAIYV